MNTRAILAVLVPGALGVALAACADWDNPTALADMELETEFEIAAGPVETFEEIEIHVHVAEGGAPLPMTEAELEIEVEATGELRVVAMHAEGDGYAAHVTFFEPGEHHLHFVGRPEQHHLMYEMGDHEMEVLRQHTVIGPYWVEMEVSPAPPHPADSAHIHFHVFDMLLDGTPGDEVGGLALELEVHDPAGVETPVAVEEEDVGEYEAKYAFGEAGMYELHLEIEVGTEHEDGEFHIPVLSEEDPGDEGDGDDGGDGHGH